MNGELKKSAISSILWKLLERGGNAFIQLVVQIVMARLLAPTDFGALAIMLVFVNIGNVIVQSGLNTALIQAENVNSSDYSTVFWMSFAVSVILYLIIFFSAPSIASFYRLPQLTWPLRGLTVVLVVGSLNSIQVAKVTRDLQMRKIFYSTIGSVVISAILGIGSAVLGAGLWALVIQQIAYQVASCVILHFLVDWSPRFVFKVERAKRFFSFGWRLLVSGLLDQGYQSLSDLIIGRQFSASDLGLVSQGKKYPNAIGSMLDGAIQPVMLSTVAHVQGDVGQVKSIVRRALKTSTYLIVPSMVAFACCAPTLVPLLLGNQWIGCVRFMQVYCLVYALFPIHTTNLQALNGLGHSDVFLKLELIKKTYGLLMLLICGFIFKDVNLLVFSYLITGVISTFVNSYPNKRYIGYSYSEQVKDIAPAFIIAAIASIPTLAIPYIGLNQIVSLLMQCLVFSTVYLGLSAIVKLDAFVYLLNISKNILRK